MAEDPTCERLRKPDQTSSSSNREISISAETDLNHRAQGISVYFAESSSSNDSKGSEGIGVPNASRVPPPPRPRGRSILDEIAAHSEDASQNPARQRPSAMSRALRYDPTTGQLVSRRSSKRERQPTHTTIHEGVPIDEHRRSPELSQHHSRGESLSSALTSSPDFGSVETPTDAYQDISSPPLVATSPVEIPDSFISLRSFQESKSGSFRRLGRRSSARTGSTSMSPAGAFLSQWNRDDYVAPSEPDDEGQEIGDSGEYIIGRQIGYGGFSVVKEAFTIEDNERVRRAVKIVRKQIAGSSEQRNEQVQTEFEHEVSIWRCLKHPYILPLIAVFDSPFATFCITQFNSGGTLFDLVRRSRRSGASDVNLRAGSATDRAKSPSGFRNLIPFRNVKRYIYQTASAIRYLHQDMHIVHRDIKLENCLLDIDSPFSGSFSSLSASISSLASIGSDTIESVPSTTSFGPGNIMLCDFGMADFITRDDREVFLPTVSHGFNDQANSNSPHNIGPGPTSVNVSTSANITGSLQYASPELISASEPLYDTSIDIWAFGVLCYALLTCDLPFTHGLAPKVQSKISKGDWDASYLSDCVKNAVALQHDECIGERAECENALELLKGCLDMDPQTRWKITNVLECAFLEKGEELFEKEDSM